MKKTDHDEAAIQYLNEASVRLTQAVGAFVLRYKDLPELHARLLAVSNEVDEIAMEIAEQFQ